ncbi:DMT family transporter [Microbulbifer sp. S227A]|uniref:DMT family transporter n=1 Tax=Microbulbifer sp. S227A TaxID=3415131 RepID=UPI003C7A4122
MRAAAFGAGLVVLYTALISSADAITKLIAGGYAAPQLFCLSGLFVVTLSALADRHPSQRRGFHSSCPRAMALRCGATVLAAVSFFYAFRYLPFAEVFLFIGLMPILAGLMSGPILGEHVRPAAWAALIAGFIGVMCLFPTGLGAVTIGHGFAMAAALFGTFSMIMARYIGRYEDNSLAQVFYPNLAIFVTMGVALPFVWKPMPVTDLGLVAAYAAFLFGARWLLVVALRLLAAYAVTPLMNLQFVWMVVLGAVIFGEYPASGTYLGVAIVIGSGLFLVWDQFTPDTARGRFSAAPWRQSRFKTDP